MAENFRVLYQNNDMYIIFDLFTSLVILLSKVHVKELSYTPFYDKKIRVIMMKHVLPFNIMFNSSG